MLLRASVSLETDTQPVRTWKGYIDAPNPRLGARRALEACQKANLGARWRSLVIVLEKTDESVEETK